MAFSDQAALSNDGDFINRVSACAAVEVPKTHQPTQWARDHIWWIAAAPGFADSYAYALQTNVPSPGKDPAVISDNQITAAVQALQNELNAPQSQ